MRCGLRQNNIDPIALLGGDVIIPGRRLSESGT